MKLKNYLFFLGLLLLSFQSYAQAISPTQTEDVPRTEEYCMVRIGATVFDRKVNLYVDYGQPQGLLLDEVKDKNGKKLQFNSEMDALNFMNGKGWEVVNALVVSTDNKCYLMRRKIAK